MIRLLWAVLLSAPAVLAQPALNPALEQEAKRIEARMQRRQAAR